MSAFPAAIADLAYSLAHRDGQEDAPKPYKADAEPIFRANLIEVLPKFSFLYLGTLTQDGWPFGGAARFVSHAADGERPVLYVEAEDGSMIAHNVKCNPRVTCEAHFAISFEQRRETRAVQFQGLASIVTDAEERALVRARFDSKFDGDGPQPARQGDTIIRIDSLSVVFFYPAARPQWGMIDYVAGPAPAAETVARKA